MAEAYRLAANQLVNSGAKGTSIPGAPGRLLAIHAIELYLNTYLLAAGMEPKKLRSLQHDLSERAALATDNGLVLRRKTALHLAYLTGSREYLLTRYAPETSATLSQINRLLATLEETARKVTDKVEFIAENGGSGVRLRR